MLENGISKIFFPEKQEVRYSQIKKNLTNEF
jgi:hypothetical protein